MAYRPAFPHNRDLPDEYEPGNPIECEECGEVYDEDDLGIELRVVDGDYLCLECMTIREQEEEKSNDGI